MTQANVLGRSGRPSYRAITELTNLSAETVRRLFLGLGDAEPDTIRRVAEVLKLKPELVSQWSGRARETVAPYEPPAEADLLTARQRRVLDDLIRVMATPAEERAPRRLAVVADPKPEPAAARRVKKRTPSAAAAQDQAADASQDPGGMDPS